VKNNVCTAVPRRQRLIDFISSFEDEPFGTQLTCPSFLLLRGGNDRDATTHRPRELHSHFSEPAQPNDRNFAPAGYWK
jgi:hypothetical protein